MRKLSDIKIDLKDFHMELLLELMQRVKIKLLGKELNKENLGQALDEMEAEYKRKNEADWKKVRSKIRRDFIIQLVTFLALLLVIGMTVLLVLK